MMHNEKKTLGLARFPLSMLGVAVVSMGLYACGGDGDDGATTPPPVPGKILVTLKVSEAPQSVLARSAKSLAQAMSLPIGFTQQYVATGTYSDRTTADLTATATWSSSDEAVATVAAGAATAALVGDTDIGACQDRVCSEPVSLEVDAAVVTTLTITPSQSEVREGGVTRLSAIAKLSGGSTPELDVTNEPALSWASSDETVVALSRDLSYSIIPGEFVGVKEGVARASVAGQLSGADFSAESEVTVTPLDVEDFALPDPVVRNWSQANTYCKSLSPAARLPTGHELLHIYKLAESNGGNVFDAFGWPMTGKGGGSTNYYWTGDDFMWSGWHYMVAMDGGDRGTVMRDEDANLRQVACVR